jgi:hypothetical protein
MNISSLAFIVKLLFTKSYFIWNKLPVWGMYCMCLDSDTGPAHSPPNQSCGTVTIYYGSGSDFCQVLVPAPYRYLDHKNQFKKNCNKSCL